MHIHLNNYEIYFIDYLDGRLTPEQIRELRSFLILHEELGELLEEMESVKLRAPAIRYPRKAVLKKEAVHECPDYKAIACAEGEMDEEEKKQFSRSRTDDRLGQEIALYRKLRLRPDPDIHYPHKKQLYRRNPVWIYRYSAIAAIFMLVWGAGILFHDNQQPAPSLLTVIPLEAPVTGMPPEYTLLPRQQPVRSGQSAVITSPERPVISSSAKRLEIARIIKLPEDGIPADPHPLPSLRQPVNNLSISSAEIILTKNAETWKPSENPVLSDNIFNSMYQAGKILADKIKTNLNSE